MSTGGHWPQQETDVYEAYMAYSARGCRDVALEMNAALRQDIETLWASTVASGYISPWNPT